MKVIYKKVYKNPIYPRDPKITTDKGFVKNDNGEQVGNKWTCFYIKDNNAYNFASFGRYPDKLLLNQLPKPIYSHKYEIQDMKVEYAEPKGFTFSI